jgi:hypothetical protein
MNPSIPEVLSPPLSPPGFNHGPQRSIAKTSALKLITSFGDQSAKSKFFDGDGGQTPAAAGVTPIAESAISPGGFDPATAFLKPSRGSAFNTPSSAGITTPGGFGRPRLSSIGEVRGEADTPAGSAAGSGRAYRPHHSRKTLVDDHRYAAGITLPRAATASPMMMRDSQRLKEVPPPSPSPEAFVARMAAAGRTSRNGARERVPEGIDMKLQSMDAAMTRDVTSPEQSVTSSTRFHWPTRRRGPGSVTSSATSNSSIGTRSHRSHHTGRSINDYVHSLEAAQRYAKKPRSRESSRHRHEKGSRDSSRNRKDKPRDTSSERGRSASRQWTPRPAKRSPTSPIPMSPEDLINLSTPRMSEIKAAEEVVVPMHLDDGEPATVRKLSQIRRTSPKRTGTSSRTSSRGGRRQSPERQAPTLDMRGRSQGRGENPAVRSPSSPVPMSEETAQFQDVSDDEQDFKAAVTAKEAFRSKHNRSRGIKDPSSPVQQKPRERSGSNKRRVRTPAAQEVQVSVGLTLQNQKEPPHAGDLKQMFMERQRKKEAAARELEERRKSLARRPSVPPIPHPDELSPIIQSRAPTAFEPARASLVAPEDVPQRSQTADFTRYSAYARNSRGPVVGLPATPKAMRLQFDHINMGPPSVPAIPALYTKTSPPPSGQQSPERPSEDAQSPVETSPLLTLLPSTVYSPPTRPNIPRCMSAPIPEEPPARTGANGQPAVPTSYGGHSRRGSVSRKMSTPEAYSSMRGMDEIIERRAHSRRSSRDDNIPPPPPPPPILKELQHLATPPPPPPAPLPGVRSPVFNGGMQGTIEIVMDEDDSNAVPTAAPVSESVVPIIAPPAPPTSRNGHNRGRSVTEKDNSLAGRISRATERMRSGSRGRNSSALGRTMSPNTTSPYESVPTVTYTEPVAVTSQSIERHPREVRGAYLQQQQGLGTGLAESEMF